MSASVRTAGARPVAALLAVLALLGVPGCAVAVAGEPAAPAGTAPAVDYRDPRGRFALELPPGWVPDPGHPGPEVVFLDAPAVADPLARLASPAIEVRVRDWPGDLGRAVDTFRPTLGAPGPAESDRPVTLPDGTPAHLFADTVPGGAGAGSAQRELQVFAVARGRLVTATARGATGEWDGYGTAVFETAVRSLTLGG